VIIDEYAMNPKYYDDMSKLLEDLVKRRQEEALDYKEYLEKLIELATKVGTRDSGRTYPAWASTGGKRAVVDFFWPDEQIAVIVDDTVMHTKLDRWVGDRLKERELRLGLRHVLGASFNRLDELLDLIKAWNEYH
jgi:type I restriction enzyme R subunit